MGGNHKNESLTGYRILVGSASFTTRKIEGEGRPTWELKKLFLLPLSGSPFAKDASLDFLDSKRTYTKDIPKRDVERRGVPIQFSKGVDWSRV